MTVKSHGDNDVAQAVCVYVPSDAFLLIMAVIHASAGHAAELPAG
jgi:hypothetical protein